MTVNAAATDIISQAITDIHASRAKRQAAVLRIRANREAAQQHVSERLAVHVNDHGAETETDREAFLRETE